MNLKIITNQSFNGEKAAIIEFTRDLKLFTFFRETKAYRLASLGVFLHEDGISLVKFEVPEDILNIPSKEFTKFFFNNHGKIEFDYFLEGEYKGLLYKREELILETFINILTHDFDKKNSFKIKEYEYLKFRFETAVKFIEIINF